MHPSSTPASDFVAAPSTAPGAANHKPGLALAALITGNVALAFGPVFVRAADTMAGVGPVASGFWRLALAVPLLFLFAALDRRPGRRGETGAAPGLLAMIALGGLFFAADLAAWHLGILGTKLANATLLGNAASLFFPVYGFLVARRWPAPGQAAALLLAMAGGALLLGRSYELSPAYLVGDLLCLAAGLLYTFYLISIDRARAQMRPWPVLALSTLAGVAPLLLFAHLVGEPIWPGDWRPVLGLALASQVIGQGCLVYAMGHVRPLVVGLAFLSQPVVAALAGLVLYGERLALADWLGAAAIGIAMVLVRRG
ncbi:EamA family transporter [Sphingomonas changnyeongensis]|uniref:EamA family transporter n=1 Tax=Sphingomonas changnyeongensis TaxID=2698679 RepID=A0A7Z2NW42_9SPHN|nr:DMT family transporter [Sphingomonas changnyeongensis]QHL90602.1 EamA family transporter [Sphingomonas changnyeongensis]